MLGGEWFEELFGSPKTATEETIKSAALETLQQHLGISQEPSHAIVNIHKVHWGVQVTKCNINECEWVPSLCGVRKFYTTEGPTNL